MISSDTRKKLEILFDMLVEKRDQHVPLDMESWGTNKVNYEAHACGTVCCAFGHATMHEPFRAMGLTNEVNIKKRATKLFDYDKVENVDVDQFNELAQDQTNVRMTLNPVFKIGDQTFHDFDAACAFFGQDMRNVFHPIAYGNETDGGARPVTYDMVIEKVERLLLYA